jgi:hypothetical protein
VGAGGERKIKKAPGEERMITVHRRHVSALFLAGALFAAPALHAAVATFDDLTEGFYGSDLVNGGIHLFDPDFYLPGSEGTFAIDQADGNLGDDPFFSSPNGLGLNGYSPGPIGGGSRFGSITFELADGRQGSVASVDVWFNQLDAPNRLVLAAFAGDLLVAATLVSGPINCCDVHKRLKIASQEPFDTVRLFGVGLANDGAAFMLVDNVRIRPSQGGAELPPVPLPGALWLLVGALGVLPLGAGRRRGRLTDAGSCTPPM